MARLLGQIDLDWGPMDLDGRDWAPKPSNGSVHGLYRNNRDGTFIVSSWL
jgi:hypothetical protein